MDRPSIIFEDASLLALDKPAGLMVEKDTFGNPSVEEFVETFFSEKRVSQNTIVGIVHRLDRPVSGVILVAKKRSILKELSKQFESGEVDKVYFAITESRPAKDEAHLQHYLRKDVRNKIAVIYKNRRDAAARCELLYKLAGETEKGFLLEVHPLTGKYHQIRAQLSFIGCPIVGDAMYGAKKKYKKDAICLHAHSISFYHPLEKKKMKLISALPADWPVSQ